MKFGALRLDKGRPQVDLVKAGFLFLRHCVFELGGLLCTWQKRLPDDLESVASYGHKLISDILQYWYGPRKLPNMV